MRLLHDPAPCLLLLLLAKQLVQSSCRPASLCSRFRSMVHHLESLINLSKDLQGLADEDVALLLAARDELTSLPHINHTASHIRRMTVNKSLVQLFMYTQSYKLHVDWLKTGLENTSLPSQAAGGAGRHLLQLTNLLDASLRQLNEEVPQVVAPALPAVSTAFDMVKFSSLISAQLNVFSMWSKTVVHNVKRMSGCPK